MKRLYILRHAKASSEDGLRDFDRPLAAQGLTEADALGKLMVQKSYNPSLVLCSGALRTRQTYESLRIASQNVEYSDTFYEASAGQILEAIQDSDNKHDSIMVVGHNPAVHELALRLSSEDSALSLLQRLLQSCKPGTMIVLDCPCTQWNDIQLAQNSLVDLQESLDYNAESRPTRWM